MPSGHSLSGGHGFGVGQRLGAVFGEAGFCVTPPCAVVGLSLASNVTPIAATPSQIVLQGLCMARTLPRATAATNGARDVTTS